MMDNKQFDQWLQQELETYEFTGLPMPDKLDMVLDRAEQVPIDAVSWWRNYWKELALGLIGFGGLLTLLSPFSKTTKLQSYTETATQEIITIQHPTSPETEEIPGLSLTASIPAQGKIASLKRIDLDQNREVRLAEYLSIAAISVEGPGPLTKPLRKVAAAVSLENKLIGETMIPLAIPLPIKRSVFQRTAYRPTAWDANSRGFSAMPTRKVQTYPMPRTRMSGPVRRGGGRR